MLELRARETAADQIAASWPTMEQIASDMMMFLTEYQRSFACYPLTLHSRDLPTDTESSRISLRQFTDNALALLPEQLPSHVGHPQWDYHVSQFVKARHSYLSTSLGSITEFEPPPPGTNPLDTLWWRYDGAMKRYARLLARITAEKEQLIAALRAPIEQEFAKERKRLEASLLSDLRSSSHSSRSANRDFFATDITSASIPSSSETDSGDTIQRYFCNLPKLFERSTSAMHSAEQNILDVEYYFGSMITEIERSAGAELNAQAAEYEKIIEQKLVSAVTPFAKILDSSEIKERPSGFLRTLYYRIFGRLPLPTFMNPYWSSYYPLRALLKNFETRGPINSLVVSNLNGSFSDVTRGLPGGRVAVSMEGLMSRNLSKIAQPLPTFDLCICEVLPNDLPRLAEIIYAARLQVGKGGTILCFYLNPDLSKEPGPEIVGHTRVGKQLGPTRFYFSDSFLSGIVQSIFRRAAQSVDIGGNLERAMFVFSLLAIQPLIWISNLTASLKSGPTFPRRYTSVVVEVSPPGTAKKAS
jgi:hypothetical protein